MASRVIRTALRLRSRPYPRRTASVVLVLAPHPDDESLGCGGTLALLARDRASVHVAFVTDGGGSHPNHPAFAPTQIAARRSAEAFTAAAALGIDRGNVTFLGAEDGTLGRVDEARGREIVAKVSALLSRVAPDTVILPRRGDGSSEHDAAFALFRRALAGAGLSPRVLEFPVWSWWNPTLLLGPLFTCRRIWRVDLRPVQEAKARALACYASQTSPIPPDTTAALPPGFVAMFLCGEEFLFEG